MNKDKYYIMHNGMSVPNGDTYQSIFKKLENGKYETFQLTENDGFSESVVYLGKENREHKFKRKFNDEIVFYKISDIHLLS